MTNAERDIRRIANVETGNQWLRRHIAASNHGDRMQVTCPMCIRIVTAYPVLLEK